MKRIELLSIIIALLLIVPVHSPAQDSSEDLPRRAISATLISGYELYQTSDLNKILEPRGYPAVPEFSPLPGVGAAMTLYQFDRNLIGSVGFRARLIDFPTDEWMNRLIALFGSIDAGYMFVQHRNFMAYAAVGGTFGTSSIMMTPKDMDKRSVEEILDDSTTSGIPLSLHTFHLGIHLEAGIEFRFLHDNEMNTLHIVGLKVGTVPIGLPPIRTLNGSAAHGINLGIPGYYALLSLGFIFL